MNFREWAKDQEAAGLAEVHTLTELQHAEVGDGPWRLYIYEPDGFYRKAPWFRKGKMKYPDEEIPIAEAKSMSNIATLTGAEVRICDGGDSLVFHSQNGEVLYGEGFWEAVTA